MGTGETELSGTAQKVEGSARVWVIEDSNATAAELARLLSRRYEVRVFHDAASAVEAFSSGTRPDVMLIDWHLPAMSGLELCRFVRERHDEVSLPVLIMTSPDAERVPAVALANGANDFLAKPYNDVELLARIGTLVRVRKLALTLREREALSATTLSSIGDGVISTDSRGLIQFINDAAESLTGWSVADATGRPIDEVFKTVDEHTFAPVPSAVHRALSDGHRATPPRDTLLVRKDGTKLPVDERASPIRLGAALSGSVLVFRDVAASRSAQHDQQRELMNVRTARAQVEEQLGVSHEARLALEATREEELQRAELEQQLIGIVSHDLRNPIAAITLSSALLLRRTDLPEGVRGPLERISVSTSRATRMVRDLLDFTRVRVGKGLPLTPDTMDVHEALRLAVDELKASNPDRVFDVACSGSGRGRWDPDRLNQVFTNLLNNAIQYGDPDEPIVVTAREDGNDVVVEVRNEGPPIPAAALERIFEPFHRGALAPVTARNVGLGLFIVKHVVDRHGGTVQVDSREGETVFTVRLPRTTAG